MLFNLKYNKKIVFACLFAGMLLNACNQDNTPPVITLLGDNPHTHCVGVPYEDAGAKATDDEDGDLTDKINVTINVNTEETGTYPVIYTVKDNAGNVAEKERTVHVIYCR
ncbi:MAG: DUF5011 domain-containing protein [Bacteroidales bacterium]|nr:DUF5011 domain-containing protein [Bacteroidales bacterium]